MSDRGEGVRDPASTTARELCVCVCVCVREGEREREREREREYK